MNNPLAIMFAMAVLLVLALGVLNALDDTQLKIGYTATAARLQQAVSEYVGAACGGGARPIEDGDTIGFNAGTGCLTHNGADVCAAWGEPGYIDEGQVELHGATLEVDLDSSPPALRLKHNNDDKARKFLYYLVSGQGDWLAYDDGDPFNPRVEGVQWLLHTRASAAEGLWLAAAGADTGCTMWDTADKALQPASLPAAVKDAVKESACQGWTEVVRDDKGVGPGDMSLSPSQEEDLWYDSVSNSSFSSADTWNYGRKQRYQEGMVEKPGCMPLMPPDNLKRRTGEPRECYRMRVCAEHNVPPDCNLPSGFCNS